MVMQSVLAAPGAATVEWTAAGHDGNGSWEPEVGDPDMVWDGAGPVSSECTGIGDVQFFRDPRLTLNGPGTEDSFQDILGDPPTDQDATWEFLIRPRNLTASQTIFNTGGGGAGTAFYQFGSMIGFRAQTSSCSVCPNSG